MSACTSSARLWNGKTYTCAREAGHTGEHRGHASDINASWPPDEPCATPSERFYDRARCGCGWSMASHACPDSVKETQQP